MKKPKAKTWRWTGNKLEKRQLPAPQATDRAHSSRGNQCQPANKYSAQPIREASYPPHLRSIEKTVPLRPPADHASGRILGGGLRSQPWPKSLLLSPHKDIIIQCLILSQHTSFMQQKRSLKQAPTWVLFQ